MELPQTNDTIVFTKVPTGSYASTGEAYKVLNQHGAVHLTSVERGCGTIDDHAMYRHAQFNTVKRD